MKTVKNKYKNSAAAFLISAYVTLLLFNVFHNHDISLLNEPAIAVQQELPAGGNDEVVNSSLFICHFSLIYNSLFFTDNFSASESIPDVYTELAVLPADNPYLLEHYHNLASRAPPVNFL